MYNTDFKVKYNDIKEELIWKLKNKTPENPEYEYNHTDILLICDKLYRDELCCVFYADNITDDRIDIGFRYILEQMILNSDFKSIMDDFKRSFFAQTDDLQDKEKEYFEQNSDFIVIITFFKKEYFYVFHKCICQQLTLGTIGRELLDEFTQVIGFN